APPARAYNEILPARYDNVLLDDFRPRVDDRELLPGCNSRARRWWRVSVAQRRR
ncbi:MAG: hypothetical protein IPF57_16315, partial [Gammaproteobacteria bacterium]|nr:hypothetical protein [Gammaproteobacteria bacterium]